MSDHLMSYLEPHILLTLLELLQLILSLLQRLFQELSQLRSLIQHQLPLNPHKLTDLI